MKRAAKYFAIGIAALLGLLFAANHYIRVGGDGQSYGIVEEVLFGRPMVEALQPPWSDEYRSWDAATRASHALADLIENHGGGEIATSPDLVKERGLAIEFSRIAYTNSAAIPREYLANSNPELAEVFFSHFVRSMDSFQRGFEHGDLELIKDGISDYNAFVLWMRNQERGDFKGLR